MTLRRHPRRVLLAAWFDGEPSLPEIGAHVAGCTRCTRYLDGLGRIRTAVRADEVVALPARRRTPKPVSAALAGAVVVALVAVAVQQRGSFDGSKLAANDVAAAPRPAAPGHRAPSASAGRAVAVTASQPARSSTPRSTSSGSEGAAGTTVTGSPSHAAPASPVSGSAPLPSVQPLRLGVDVPSDVADTTEGRQVVAAARQAVAAANAAGGVAGRQIELVVVGDSPPSVTPDVYVGGFTPPGSERGRTWLLPADPSASGPAVLPAEVDAETAGRMLGQQVRGTRRSDPVAVVVGDGAEAAMAQGLAATGPTVTASPDGGDCEPAVRTLRMRAPAALAVAGDERLARDCIAAAIAIGWLPPGGILLPPAVAYGRADTGWASVGVRTVFGLPWPSSGAPGAARFRASTGSASYRALVTFAAAELAIAVTRTSGTPGLALVSQGVWRTDLVDIEGGVNRGAAVVVATPTGWERTA